MTAAAISSRKAYLFGVVGGLAATFALVGCGKAPTGIVDAKTLVACTGEVDQAWVNEQRDAVVNNDLFRYGIRKAGPPTRCTAKITDKSEDGRFGSILFYFKDGTVYSAESVPPETSMASLTKADGFANETEVLVALKKATADWLKIDWSKPQIEKSGDTETKTFWDPDDGINGRGFLTYKNGRLISVGDGIAL